MKSTTNTSSVVLTWFSVIVFRKCLPALAFSGGADIALNQTTADFVVTYATSYSFLQLMSPGNLGLEMQSWTVCIFESVNLKEPSKLILDCFFT